MRTFGAVVGKPATPTPTGQFFVEETVQIAAGEPDGPFALALSARSNVLTPSSTGGWNGSGEIRGGRGRSAG